MNNAVKTLAGIVLLLGVFPSRDFAADRKGEAEFLSNIRQLTFEGSRSGEGYFSPDGKSLIFQSEREPGNPFYQIYILDFESGDTHRVSPGIGKTTCGFFRPGSDEVLFASTHHDPQAKAKQKAELDFRASGKQKRYSWDYDDEMEIYAARRDGSNLHCLTDARGYDAEGSYSPDGSKIVFTSLRNAYPSEKLSSEDRKRLETDPSYFAEIYIMNADGSDQRRLTSTPGYDGGPFFSPDGQRIVWRRFNEQGTIADVYTMKLDGSDVRLLTDFGAMSWAPYYHPSGHYLIFTANKLGFSNFELYLTDVDGEKQPVRVTFTDGFDGLPVFSPNGRTICWSSSRTADGKTQLFLADWNHDAALAALRTSESRSGQSGSTDKPEPKVSPSAAAIAETPLRQDVQFLASDALEGRLTGSSGARQAADFIESKLAAAGLKPWAGGRTFGNGSSNARNSNQWFQEFDFTAGVRIMTNANRLAVSEDGGAGTSFEVEKGFRPLSFTAGGEVEADVVFAGYGLAVPGKTGEGYDSYAGINVSNKVVLVFRYVPEEVDAKRRQELNRYAGLRYKALVARTHGARALLIVSGPNSPNPGALAALSSDNSLSGSGIVAASVSTQVAETILKRAGKDLKALQSALDKEDPHAAGSFAIPGVKVRMTVGIERIREKDRNVLAILHSLSQPTNHDYVLVGAHYDHLGRGDANSLAHKDEEGQIHNGADDNASGVSLLLELAGSLAAEQKLKPDLFQKPIVFAFWSGEEMGLIGSSYFAEHSPEPLSNAVAYVNFDMVGRLRDNKLILQGVGSSTLWKRLIEKRNVAAGFNLVLQEDPYLPTDVTALYPKGVPAISFFTGSHEDYHRPSDDPETLNYEGLARITRFARSMILDLARGNERPDYVKVESKANSGGRDMLRAYLGTIPDYATEVSGVKLSGVRGGSPAETAGLKGGDIIVEFGGQKVANIYDYTYALDAAKIGKPVEVIVMRDGKRVSVQVTPAVRP